jgi:hypothetical protein
MTRGPKVTRDPTFSAADVDRESTCLRQRRQECLPMEAPVAVMSRLPGPPNPVGSLLLPRLAKAHSGRAEIGVSTTSPPWSSTRYAAFPGMTRIASANSVPSNTSPTPSSAA